MSSALQFTPGMPPGAGEPPNLSEESWEITFHCFKLLSFGDVSYAKIENQMVFNITSSRVNLTYPIISSHLLVFCLRTSLLPVKRNESS